MRLRKPLGPTHPGLVRSWVISTVLSSTFGGISTVLWPIADLVARACETHKSGCRDSTAVAGGACITRCIHLCTVMEEGCPGSVTDLAGSAC